MVSDWIRKQWFLIIGLIAISTLLFVVGIVVERQTENGEAPAIHESSSAASVANQESGEGEAGRDEANEVKPVAQNPVAAIESSESIMGVNLESPWLIAAAVGGWIVLAAALLRFGYPILPIISMVALAMLILDITEVVRQLNRSNTGLALLAAGVVLAHGTVAVVSTRLFIRWRWVQPAA